MALSVWYTIKRLLEEGLKHSFLDILEEKIQNTDYMAKIRDVKSVSDEKLLDVEIICQKSRSSQFLIKPGENKFNKPHANFPIGTVLKL